MAKKELAKKAAVVRATTKEDKKTALDGALKQIEKKYGAGAIMRLGIRKSHEKPLLKKLMPTNCSVTL